MNTARRTMRSSLGVLCLLVLPAQAVPGHARGFDRIKERSEAYVTMEAGGIDQNGSKLAVREYDRREYPAVDVREFEVYSEDDDSDFYLGIWNPVSSVFHEGTVRYQKDDLDIDYQMIGLTHHMPSFRQNFIVDGVRRVLIPNTIPLSAANPFFTEGNWDPNTNRLDLDSGFPFHLDRIEHDFNLNYGDLRKVRGRFGYWVEDEKGNVEQFRTGAYPGALNRNQFGLTFSNLEHPQTSFAHPYDRTAREIEVGIDAQIRSASVYATYFDQDLDEDTPSFDFQFRPDGADNLANALSQYRFSDREGNGVRFGINSPIGDKVHGSVYLVDRNRKNTFTGNELDMDTFTANLSWAPSRKLYLSSQFRHYERTTHRNLGFVPADSAGNSQLDPAIGIWDEERDEVSLEARFSGLKDHTVRVGARAKTSRRPNDERLFRQINRLDESSAVDGSEFSGFFLRGWEDPLLLVHPSSSEVGYWVKVQGNPLDSRKLYYRASFEGTSGNRPTISRGVVTDEHRWNGNVTYDLREDVSLYADFNYRDGEGDDVPYAEQYATWSVGAHGMMGRWGIGAYYNHESWDTDWLSGWQYNSGAAASGNFRGIPINYEPFDSEQENITLHITPPKQGRLRTQGSFTYSQADSYQPLAQYSHHFALIGFNLTPGNSDFLANNTQFDDVNAVDTAITRIRLQGDYELDEDSSVGIDFQHGRWKDRIDAMQNGSYNIAWLNYSTKLW